MAHYTEESIKLFRELLKQLKIEYIDKDKTFLADKITNLKLTTLVEDVNPILKGDVIIYERIGTAGITYILRLMVTKDGKKYTELFISFCSPKDTFSRFKGIKEAFKRGSFVILGYSFPEIKRILRNSGNIIIALYLLRLLNVIEIPSWYTKALRKYAVKRPSEKEE